MPCVRKRRGRWVADFRDSTGRRRWISRRTKTEAQRALADALPSATPRRRRITPETTLIAYAGPWLRVQGEVLKPRSVVAYARQLENHILPALGRLELRRIGRGQVREFLSGELGRGASVGTVALTLAVLRSLLNAALEDGLVTANPAARLGRALRLPSKAERTEHVKALNTDQVRDLCAAAAPEWRPLWFLVSRTGVRIGEALALKWADVDLHRLELRVELAVAPDGTISSPKSGHGRTVDVSPTLCELLADLAVGRNPPAAVVTPCGPWLFPSLTDPTRPRTHSVTGKAFRRDLASAGLPLHFTPHSLRHSFASILLAAGVSPVYVQEQLGHKSIELTVGTYGRWLRKRSPEALAHLEAS